MAESGIAGEATGDGEKVKLFVGQVPKHMTEADLVGLFEEVAVVEEVNVIKDKATKASRGCCFAVCKSRDEADKAVEGLHNKRTLPGASSPLQVKYADGELERLEHKLFIGMLPKNVTEAELSSLFSKYGNIRDMQILRGSQQTSKGCAFLKYATKEQAVAAKEAINGIHQMEGSTVPLVVKWADTEKERQARKAQKAQSQILASAGINNAAQQPSIFGALPMGYAPPYNGYSYQGPGAYGLMQYPLTSMQNQPGLHNIVPPVSQGNSSLGINTTLSSSLAARNLAMQTAAYIGSAYPALSSLQYPVAYTGPSGANLFIYHIPQNYGDQELSSTFQPFGKVLSAKVYVDKTTGISKCFGFVSYDSAESAVTAIKMMNGHQIGGKQLKVQLKRDNK